MGAQNILPTWLIPPFVLTLLSVGLYWGRVFATGTGHLAFLNWNLILAWLPLWFAWWLASTLKTRRWYSANAVILTLFWLMFLPNSFYIVTDFIHLKPGTGISLLYDVILIMSFTLTGLLLGCMSVFILHKELIRRVSKRRVLDILGSVFLLSGFAIYLGRNLGYNSWDLLANPFGILLDVSDRIASPDVYGSMYSTTLLFFVFISAVYAAFYNLRGRLKS